MTKRVAVLMGGWSAEREVSLVERAANAPTRWTRPATRSRRIDVDARSRGAGRGAEPRPDVVFNALHGRGGEDGTIQGVLEMLAHPLHPFRRARLGAGDGQADGEGGVRRAPACRSPRAVVVARAELADGDPMPRALRRQADQRGLERRRAHRPRRRQFLARARSRGWAFGDEVLVERYVPGRELTVAVMGDRALGVCEIVPDAAASTTTQRNTPRAARSISCPAPVPPAAYEEALDIALRAHRALGCRGVSRADLRYDDTRGRARPACYLLEINTQPGMTPTSLVPDIARHAASASPSWSRWMVENARMRTPEPPRAPPRRARPAPPSPRCCAAAALWVGAGAARRRRRRRWLSARGAGRSARRCSAPPSACSTAQRELGLVVADVQVEGRETTDRETILRGARRARGTPILAVEPERAKAQLEALPWVRSAVGRAPAARHALSSASSSASRWRSGSMAASSS